MKRSFSGVIDRIEGEYAVVLIGPDRDERLEIKRVLLPEEAKEGDIVSLSIKVSPNKTREAKAKVADMIERLENQ